MALEMVLNELSLQPTDDVQTARQRMSRLIRTLRSAVRHHISRTIRTESDIFDIMLAQNYPLRRWLNDRQVDRVERQYFRSLATKFPFWDELPDLYEQVLSSEFRYNVTRKRSDA